MNLVLLIWNFPLISIRVENREKYLKSLEKAQLTWETKDYYDFMCNEIIYWIEELIEF